MAGPASERSVFMACASTGRAALGGRVSPSRRWLAGLASAVGVGLVLVLVAPAAARAADSVYWSTSSAIRVADLDGTGSAANLFIAESAPRGVAIDPAAGRI